MQNSEKDTITINFSAIFKILWKEKYLLILILLIFVCLGGWYAFTAQEEFVSEGKILPELQSNKSGKLGSLAGLANLAGLDINNLEGIEAIRPDLYPDVLRSTPFFLALFKQTVTTRNNKAINFEAFYNQIIEKGEKPKEEFTNKFPVRENGFLVINSLSEKRIKALKQRIIAGIDKKTGIITISVKMPDPVVAACIARVSMIYLTEYITNYRINKIKKDLDFLEEKVDAARGKFYSNQTKKAQYGDQFQLPTIRLQSADIQRERIESEYRMSSTVYNELLKKYEEAKIKVQQETPVFQVLEPPIAPTRKSEPRKMVIILGSILLGVIISLFIILLKRKNFKQVFLSN